MPLFTDDQVGFTNYLSSLLPLVRLHEYVIVKLLLSGNKTYKELTDSLEELNMGFPQEEIDHALKFLQYIKREDGKIGLDVSLDDQFLEYLNDLIAYGMTRYHIDNGDEKGFTLWHSYRMDQVQLKMLKNPGSNQKGTYYYEDIVVIFASLKKDLEEADRLNYKDKYLQPDLFQWESMADLPQTDLAKLKASRFTHVFIRKVDKENGVVLPFTYVGIGHLMNPRKTEGGNGTYLFDIHMEQELPEYLQYDFGLTKE